MDNNLTNEQKLDEVYALVKRMEHRYMMASFGRIIKWIIILGIVGFVASNPKLIVENITEYVKPIIMDQVKTMTEDLNNQLIQGAKGILPSK